MNEFKTNKDAETAQRTLKPEQLLASPLVDSSLNSWKLTNRSTHIKAGAASDIPSGGSYTLYCTPSATYRPIFAEDGQAFFHISPNH
ncbi:Fc.00g027870.m01.CDS01 [Cosmosporella sp. VM-42]